MSSPSPLSLADAHHVLTQWDCLSPAPTPEAYRQIREALQMVVAHSDYQILGICADSLSQGHRALMAYAQALAYTVDDSALSLNTPPRSTYIKYNPTSGLLYASDYDGTHRGVLVACQSETTEGINEMYGHLPLDLFDGVPLP